MQLKKLLFYSCISLLFVSCKKEAVANKKVDKITKTTTLLDDEYLIKGQTFNKNIESVILYKIAKDSLIPIDTTSVENNTFKFKGIITDPAYFLIKTNTSNTSFKILADASKIDLFLHDKLSNSTTYSTSEIQEKYKTYTSKMSDFQNKGIELYYNLKGDFSKTNIDNLKQDRAKLFKEQSDYIVDFINNNPDSYLSAILLDDNLKYFSTSKLRSLYEGLSTELKEYDLSNSINASITDLEVAEKDKLWVKPTTTPSQPIIGGEYRANAYALSGLNPDGNRMSLESIPQGKVVLLDFWASWCGPCRADNPNLVQLYNKYKNKGLVIMSISEDKGEGEWINAIYTDNLSWKYHIIDKNKSIAFRYGVEAIPHKVLIDKYGRIANDKISGKSLEYRIQQLLSE